jgi:hypothetical protein
MPVMQGTFFLPDSCVSNISTILTDATPRHASSTWGLEKIRQGRQTQEIEKGIDHKVQQKNSSTWGLEKIRQGRQKQEIEKGIDHKVQQKNS